MSVSHAPMRHLEELLERYPLLKGTCCETIRDAYRKLEHCIQGGGKLLVCGNGGSAADAEHLVGELMNRYRFTRRLSPSDRAALTAAAGDDAPFLCRHLQPAVAAISLVSQSALVTSVSNDISAEVIFAQQVFAYGHPGDTLIALSTSGDSRNVVLAAATAKARGMSVLGLCGATGGKLRVLCDICICVPQTEACKVQELHLPVYHTLCAMLEETLFIPAQ